MADGKQRAEWLPSGLSAEQLRRIFPGCPKPGDMQMYSSGEENGPENRESGRGVVRGFESYHLRFYVDVLKWLRGLIANQLEPLCGAWVRPPPSTWID